MPLQELLETLLASRGVSPDERDDFLNPKYEKLHSPLLLPDMERARDRLIEAVENNEHIVVFSDYDADGIPGAVVLDDLFKRIGYENVSFYIPHRHDEGYGLNLEAMEECAERGARLIVTVDCGINDVAEIALAKERGIDAIITDHHEPKDKLPEAYAIVNPKRVDSKYPFKELCGSAVAFKLMQAVLDKKSFGVKEGMEKWSLDMVGIATLSDMVPLVGENRILAKFGLEVLRKSPRPGLQALFKKMNMDQKHLSEDDVTFMLTPRINAASRMGVPLDAFKLLSTKDPEEAEVLALHLEKINNERKGLVASMVKEAKSLVEKREILKKVIVVGNPEWKPSLLGLVANSLVEEYSRPVFVWGRDGDGTLKGSCRSYNGYNLFSLMSASSDSFIEFGGHAGAGGFSITLDNLTILEDSLSQALTNLVGTGEDDVPHDTVDLSLVDIGEDLWKVISSLSPFGLGNEKPVFKIRSEIKEVRQFGKEQNHLEITLTDGKKIVKAISFFSSPTTYSLLPTTTACSLNCTLEKSYFRNRPELRLRIVDIINA